VEEQREQQNKSLGCCAYGDLCEVHPDPNLTSRPPARRRPDHSKAGGDVGEARLNHPQTQDVRGQGGPVAQAM
jgi:hypothetical protein